MEEIRTWVKSTLEELKISNSSSSIHFDQIVDIEAYSAKNLWNISLKLFNDLGGVLKDIDLGDFDIYISIDLKENNEGLKLPVSEEGIIDEIDSYSMPSIVMYKPTNSGIIPEIEFYRTPIWINNLELDGFVFYKAYRDEYSFRENLEYERELNLLLRTSVG